MNTLEVRNKTKEKIDTLFNHVEEFKVKSNQIDHQLGEEWNSAIEALNKTKDSMEDLYQKITTANEETLGELSEAFNEQWNNAEQRVNKIREIYSKTLN